MTDIDRDQVQRMMDEQAAVVVDVLPPESYAESHLPGAINVPLGDDFDTAIATTVANKAQPVIVYCWDESCPASPEAAARMEALGYTRVYDYVAGKADWLAAGKPVAP
ncbi:MAG: rhodanese-like domain-containing protein [Geminicoccaceae bacterium]|nr:MAG: rhodanese-like domain-containing protein [Geminicoccaceae bacterium]